MTALKPVLSHQESVLYGRLVRAFPGHVILARVALAHLLMLEHAAAADSRALIKVSKQWVASLVVCRPDFTPLAVFELDDSRGSAGAQRLTLCAQDRALQSAGIKVIRLAADDIPRETSLKTLVAAVPLNSSTAQLQRRAS